MPIKIYTICFSLLLVKLVNAQIFNEVNSNTLLKVRYGDVEMVDLDNDGDNDLIVSGSISSSNGLTYTYKNNGSGQFSLFQSSGLPTVDFSALATGDIDNDGDIDLFVTGYWSWSGYHSELFINNGAGHFSSVNQLFPGVGMGESEFFDADNDGDLDLFYFGRTSQFNQISKLFFNNGSGNFIESSQSFPPNHKGSLEIGDVNADGYLDILMSGESGSIAGTTQLLLNQGNGTFVDSGQSFAPISLGTAKLIDLEPDGDLDIIVNGLTNGAWWFHSVFYENDGTGNYTDIGNKGLDSLRNNTLIIADIDMDGDQDIFLSGRNENDEDTCAIYLNNQTNFVKDSIFSHQGLFDGGAVFGSMTGDCGMDLFYCGYGDSCNNESYLFRNDLIVTTNCPPEEIDNENVPDVEYVISSNPFSDFIRVDVSTAIDRVLLYDDRGRLVKEIYQNDSIIFLNVMDLSDGTYFLRFRTVNWNLEFQEKLIKVD